MPRHHTDGNERFVLRRIESDPVDVKIAVVRGQDRTVDNRVFVDFSGVRDLRVEHDLPGRRQRLVFIRRYSRIQPGHVGKHEPVDRDCFTGIQGIGKERQPGSGNYAIRHRVIPPH